MVMLRNTLPFAFMVTGMTLLALSAFDLLEYARFLHSFAWR